MTGFFTKDQTKSIVRPDGWHLSCNSCGLYKDANSPKMQPYGSFEKGIMLIGEYPEETDDIRGKPFQGKAGVLLRKTLEELGIDLFKDCISLYAANCRPKDEDSKTRKPKPFEIDCCRRIVLGHIKQYKPKMIILLGIEAVKSVIGNRWKKDLGVIDKWRGFTIPDQDLKIWICPVFSPTYVLREDKPEVTNVWKRDLFNALDTSNKLFPIYEEPTIHYLSENELGQLRKIKSGKIAFDYETTGLKPHAVGHRIVCMSIAVSADEVYVFMMPVRKALQQPVIEILENENIGKIAHNAKYELAWTFNCLRGTVVQNWIQDTMIKAHVLDNRSGITGLKFQTLISFGVYDYSSEVSPYLSTESEKGSNGINQLLEYVKTPGNAQKVLKYCSYDAIFTLRLSILQNQQFEQLLLPF